MDCDLGNKSAYVTDEMISDIEKRKPYSVLGLLQDRYDSRMLHARGHDSEVARCEKEAEFYRKLAAQDRVDCEKIAAAIKILAAGA